MNNDIPQGWQEVTEQQFYAALKADRRDIMPSVKYPFVTIWAPQHGHGEFGRSWPGWKNPGDPEKYALAPR